MNTYAKIHMLIDTGNSGQNWGEVEVRPHPNSARAALTVSDANGSSFVLSATPSALRMVVARIQDALDELPTDTECAEAGR